MHKSNRFATWITCKHKEKEWMAKLNVQSECVLRNAVNSTPFLPLHESTPFSTVAQSILFSAKTSSDDSGKDKESRGERKIRIFIKRSKLEFIWKCPGVTCSLYHRPSLRSTRRCSRCSARFRKGQLEARRARCSPNLQVEFWPRSKCGDSRPSPTWPVWCSDDRWMTATPLFSSRQRRSPVSEGWRKMRGVKINNYRYLRSILAILESHSGVQIFAK